MTHHYDEMPVLPDSTVDFDSPPSLQTSTSFPMMMPPSSSSSASGNTNAPGSRVRRILAKFSRDSHILSDKLPRTVGL